MSIGFATRDGTVLPAHEVALGIYLLMLNEPKLIFDRIWKFIEPNIPTDRQAFEGAYFARHLEQARQEGRICRVAVDPILPAKAFFDIGGAYEEPPANSRRIRRPPPPRMGTHWSD